MAIFKKPRFFSNRACAYSNRWIISRLHNFVSNDFRLFRGQDVPPTFTFYIISYESPLTWIPDWCRTHSNWSWSVASPSALPSSRTFAGTKMKHLMAKKFFKVAISYGLFFTGAIYLRTVEVTSSKIVINLPWNYEKLYCKG